MNFLFTPNALADLMWWAQHNRQTARRIHTLLQDIARNGAEHGIGKPELLRHDFAGFSSRRIDQEHRLIYRVIDDRVEVVSCRFHYTK